MPFLGSYLAVIALNAVGVFLFAALKVPPPRPAAWRNDHVMTATPAIVTFYRLIPEAALPQRADRSALGSLPTRAYRYCDAVTSAAGFGWHVALAYVVGFFILFVTLGWHPDAGHKPVKGVQVESVAPENVGTEQATRP